MIKSGYSLDRLYVLLLFGDNMHRFEKEIITGFSEEDMYGETYNFQREEILIRFKVPIKDYFDWKEESISYPKNDLIKYIIDIETSGALFNLKRNYYKTKDYGKHQWLFARIMKCFLCASKVDPVQYPYASEFLICFSEVVNESIRLYKGIFDNQQNLREVNRILNTIPHRIVTGYKLKTDIYYPKINTFIKQLVVSGFIGSNDINKFKRFLQGKFPEPNEKIEWLKDLKYLVYFIKVLNAKVNQLPKYLLSPRKQQWKYIYYIFSYEHNPLPQKFYANKNKLGRKYQKEINGHFNCLVD